MKITELKALFYSDPPAYWRELKKLCTVKGLRRGDCADWRGVYSAALWEKTELLREEEMEVYEKARKTIKASESKTPEPK